MSWQTAIISNTHQMKSVGTGIRDLLQFGEVEIKVKQYKETRKSAQNRLLWRWHNEFCKWRYEVAGEVFSPEQWHEIFKKQFLGTEDPVKVNGEWVITPKSTAKLSVGDFNELLTKYQAEAAEMGLQLTSNDDLYWKAIMREAA